MISLSENSAYVTQRLKCNQYLEAIAREAVSRRYTCLLRSTEFFFVVLS